MLTQTIIIEDTCGMMESSTSVKGIRKVRYNVYIGDNLSNYDPAKSLSHRQHEVGTQLVFRP